MRKRRKPFLVPLTGFALLVLLVFSFRSFGRLSSHRLPVVGAGLSARTGVPPVSRPVPVPLPKPSALPPGSAPVFPPGKGKIAIVLDDWGYTLKQVPALESVRSPLTVSVLPGLPHSADVARAAQASGHEVILHMPMEALDQKAPRERRVLLTGMPRRQVLDLLSQSLGTVPSARGINNHQGSKATSDPALMEIVLQETKRRGLYFLDSYVTHRSVCAEVARRVRIPFARRAVFLDNERSDLAIRRQLAELARAASEHGQAIGIGHDRPVTMDVLRRAVPALEKAGYTLVPASDLTKVPDDRSRD